MLTDVAVRQAKAADKPYKMADGQGLYLLVTTTGGRSWRMDYRFGGKRRTVTFGLYPDVSLVDARRKRDAARKELSEGIDPGAEVEPSAPPAIFEAVAREWHALNKPRWQPSHAGSVMSQLEQDVFPILGSKVIGTINAPMVLAALRRIEARGAIDTARRLRQRISAVFVYGIASGICIDDPAAIIMRAMAPMKVAGLRPALTTIGDARQIIAACDAADGMPNIKLALRLLALTSVRPGELVGAAWDEFEGLDGDAPLWRIPKSRMKGELGAQFEHWVPLSAQAVATVLAVPRKGALLFPNRRSPLVPMTGEALSALLARAGYRGRHVPHGWRSTFSTLMNHVVERQGRIEDRAIIDLMLAHTPKSGVEHLYNRSAYMDRRREIAQAWADLILPMAA
jgi:integrase